MSSTAPIETLVPPEPSAAPEPTPFSGPRAVTASPSVFETALHTLSRKLVDPDAGSIAETIALSLETLGRGLEADAVDFFAADSIVPHVEGAKGFEHADRWVAEPLRAADAGARLPKTLDLDAQPAVREALVAGRAYRLPVGMGLGASTEHEPARIVGWRRMQTFLFLPCPSPSGLLGFFAVEASTRARHANPARVADAGHVGRLAGLALDRLRLEGAVAARRKESAHRTRLEGVGRVASATAHDLNNILTSVLGFGELLEMELDLAPGKPGYEDFAELRGATQRAASVVNELLRFGRRPNDGAEDLDLGDTILSLSGMIRQVLGRQVEFAIDPDPHATPVRLDRCRLESALLNLAANARDALGGAGRFELASRLVHVDGSGRDDAAPSDPIPDLRPGDYVRLTARDEGCGIPERLRQRILEPFFTTKAPGKGTGLGLPSVVEFVRAAQGGLRVESGEGEGTAFHLYFPLRSDAVRA